MPRPKERNYLSPTRVPPARLHLRKLVDSLLETFVFPNVPPPEEKPVVEWSSNILIPSISWSTRVQGARVSLIYRFADPTRIVAEAYWDLASNTSVMFRVDHTVPMNVYTTSLKGLCSLALAKKFNDSIPPQLASKIPAPLYDYLVRCTEDKIDSSKLDTKYRQGEYCDSFEFSLNLDKGTNAKREFSAGSVLTFHARDYVLTPDCYMLNAKDTDRSICILDKKPADESPVFRGGVAPPRILSETVTTTPRVLATLLNEPDAIYEATVAHLQKLTDAVLAESVSNLRYIVDMDLAYSGGGLGGVTVDLAEPSQEQRNSFNSSVKLFKDNTIETFHNCKQDVPDIIKRVLSLFYIFTDFALADNDELFLFPRGINWADLLEEEKYQET